MLDALLRRRFVKLHGEGEAHQSDLYRCITCSRLITWNRIRSGNTCCTGRVRPTDPTFLEIVRLLFLPWTI